ncbi:unnamed protein product [Moneuplotes crassus]|uniref:Uncharacterized protein n=2 Tax=Euplotes crassus TaxID=5936 RepID=A0AAD1U9C6_EUPCR|nr:unnamed protein product [Moneuplotes crassus]
MGFNRPLERNSKNKKNYKKHSEYVNEEIVYKNRETDSIEKEHILSTSRSNLNIKDQELMRESLKDPRLSKKFPASKSRNEFGEKVSLTIFSLKDAVNKTGRGIKSSRMSGNGSQMSLIPSKTKNHFKKPKNSALYEASINLPKAESQCKRYKKQIKPVLRKSHERSKSNLKAVSESVVQTFDGFVRTLINFKTDLLSLQHNDRYSSETENLVKLIQKYLEKCNRIQMKSSVSKNPSISKIKAHAENPSAMEYFENDNFVDLLEEKDKKCAEYASKYKKAKQDRENLLERIAILESDNKEMERQLTINKKHEEIETIFSKLSSLILSSNVDVTSALKHSEKEVINNLLGDSKQAPLVDIMNTNPSTILKQNTSIFETIEDEFSIPPFKHSNTNVSSFSTYKGQSMNSCGTRKRNKRGKRELLHCKSIDLLNNIEKLNSLQDDQMSTNDGKPGCRKKKVRINDLYSIIHCQAKLMEENYLV